MMAVMATSGPWARSLTDQNVMPIYHLSFDHTIEDDSGTDGLPGQAGSPAACNNGNVHFYRDLHGGHQVGDVPRDNHAQRLDLVDAGVGAVEPPRSGIETNLSLDMGPQMLGQGDPLLLNEICHEGIVPPSVQSGKRVLSGGRKPP